MRLKAMVLLTALVSSCSDGEQTPVSTSFDEPVVSLPAPLASASYSRAGRTEEYYVRSLPGTPITEIVDMTVFGEFSPGITFKEAEAAFGAPSRIRVEGESTYHEYQTEIGTVEVAWEVHQSSGKHEAWRLHAYPSNGELAATLPRALAGITAPPGVSLTQVVFLGPGQPEVVVEIKEGRVARLTWYPAL